MQQIKDLERINLAELQAGVPLNASWHAQFKDSNYVFVGGLPFNLTEVSEGELFVRHDVVGSTQGNMQHAHQQHIQTTTTR
jgi:hypothetical protein